MALVNSTAPVKQILQRAGVHNFIKIYDSFEELQRASAEIIQQTSAVNIGDVRMAQAAQPAKSEFEDFRAAIGSAIEPATVAPSQPAYAPPPPPVQQQPMFPPAQEFSPLQAPPQRQASAPQNFAPPPPQFNAPPPPPTFVPQPPTFQQQPSSPVSTQSFQRQSVMPQRQAAPQFEQEEYDDTVPQKKGAPVALFAVIGVVLVAIIAGVVFFLTNNKPAEEVAAPAAVTAPKATEPAPYPAPVVETVAQPAQVTAPAEEKVASAGKPTKVESKAESKKAAKEDAGQIVITSTPSGALVSYNGKTLGQTPYTWNDPDAFGQISLTVELAGYDKASQSFEFTGGKAHKDFVLTKSVDQAKEAAARAAAAKAAQDAALTKAASVKAAQDAAAAKAAQDAAAKAAANKAAQDAATAKAAQDASAKAAANKAAQDAAAAKAAQDAATKAAAAKAAQAAQVAAAPKGDPATIFIVTTPPMADVIIDGKPAGKAQVSETKSTSGTHTFEFVKGDKHKTQQVTLQPGKNPALVVTLQ